jgi:hypothetical protein
VRVPQAAHLSNEADGKTEQPRQNEADEVDKTNQPGAPVNHGNVLVAQAPKH